MQIVLIQIMYSFFVNGYFQALIHHSIIIPTLKTIKTN